MKIVNNHAHAETLYESIHLRHFFALLSSFATARSKGCLTLTAHLPLEIQHPQIFKNKVGAIIFVYFGELLKYLFSIPLYWENSPLLEYGSWKLKYGQLDWNSIPPYIQLCLDTGHLMLGSKNAFEARKRIRAFIRRFDKRIGHLHIHENKFIKDDHFRPNAVINSKLLKSIIKSRTYIFEKG